MRTGIDADTIHIAPRETYIRNVLDILGLGDNKVQTRQKSDEDEPRLGEEDRRAYHRCVGIIRHLLNYRSDIAFAVREVTKTLASTGDAGLRRLRRLGRYLLATQKLGIMIRNSNDPEHPDAFTDADWSGDSIDRKSTSGGTLKLGSATLREFTKGQSCQTLSSGGAGDHNRRGFAPPTTSGILGNAGEAPIKHRFDSSPRLHPEARMRTSQAH